MADPLAFLGEHRDEALDVAESVRYLLAADAAGPRRPTRRRALLPRLVAEFPWLAGALKALAVGCAHCARSARAFGPSCRDALSSPKLCIGLLATSAHRDSSGRRPERSERADVPPEHRKSGRSPQADAWTHPSLVWAQAAGLARVAGLFEPAAASGAAPAHPAALALATATLERLAAG